MPEFYMILARKIIKVPEFLLYLPEKNYKIPEFYMIFARKKCPNNNCPKNIISRILGGHVLPCPPRLLRLCLDMSLDPRK